MSVCWYMLSGGAARVLMCRLCPDPGLSAGGARLAENRHQCLQGRKWEHLQPCAGGGLRIRRPHCPPPLGRCVLAVLLNKSFALQHYLHPVTLCCHGYTGYHVTGPARETSVLVQIK